MASAVVWTRSAESASIDAPVAAAFTPLPSCAVLAVEILASATEPPTAVAPPAPPSASVVTVVLLLLWTFSVPTASRMVVPATVAAALAETFDNARAASALSEPSGAAEAVTWPFTSTSALMSTLPVVAAMLLAPSIWVCAVASSASVARVCWLIVAVALASESRSTLPPTICAPCTAINAAAGWPAAPTALASKVTLPAVKPLLALA